MNEEKREGCLVDGTYNIIIILHLSYSSYLAKKPNKCNHYECKDWHAHHHGNNSHPNPKIFVHAI